MSGFETFTKTLVALGRDPQVTIQKRGTITLNAAAYAALHEPQAVELLFDRDDLVLGLRPCEPRLGHGVFVRPATRSPNGPYVVSAMAFLKYYGIDTTVARKFRAEVRWPVLCADLAGPCAVVSKLPH
ncbi:hypothetical protein [Jatrophihabitans endophyticus]|uniref:hypothetical protein n=1 Tax=Jatrophihabitans endophyticus TaxID=1206085 RepID=UPI000934BD81|nr:hypothetical protein [Jatrophihabitans endophyticus]